MAVELKEREGVWKTTLAIITTTTTTSITPIPITLITPISSNSKW